MLGCEPDDQFAMITRLRARRHNQAAIRSAREIGYAALDLSGVEHADRAKLHPQLRGSGLNGAQLPNARDLGESRSTATRVTRGAISLSSSAISR